MSKPTVEYPVLQSCGREECVCKTTVLKPCNRKTCTDPTNCSHSTVRIVTHHHKNCHQAQ